MSSRGSARPPSEEVLDILHDCRTGAVDILELRAEAAALAIEHEVDISPATRPHHDLELIIGIPPQPDTQRLRNLYA
jgi:hypothetical protein